jgi:nucleoid DNA-binding protein
VSKIFDRLEDYPKKAGEQAFKEAISRLRDTCGLSHEMADTIVRVFAKELADSLVQNKVLEIPHMGTLYYFNKVQGVGMGFRVSQDYKATRNKGGTDENNFIRAVEKSTPRSTRRSENDIKTGE